MHYNNLKDDKNGGELEEFDFHRFVLFLNHTFNDKTRFFSELEVEHAFIRDTDTNTAAGGGTNPARGEVALEQAYIEHDLASDLQLRAGLQLVPIGILNETHEPPTFYGVERNPIETRIIPSTYRVGGLGLNGKVGSSGWSYDVMLHEGLKVAAVTGNSAFGVRDARQRNAQADAEDLAATGRIKYNGIPGLTVGAAIQYNRGVTQGNTAGLLATDDKDQDAVLAALNAEWQRGPFTARALYARFDVDSDTAKALNRDLQQGYYLEAGYRFLPDVGAFVRYNVYDDIRRSIAPNDDFEVKQTDVGINYWLNPNVVFKADYQLQSGADDDDGINLGVGYQF